jgi:hypothetical protein
MKYLITENKMNSLIDSYITKQLGNLEHIKDVGKLSRKDVWVDSDRNPVIIIINYKGVAPDIYLPDIYLLDTVFDNIYHMFSMDGPEDIQNHLLRWFNEHMGIKSDSIETFDNE